MIAQRLERNASLAAFLTEQPRTSSPGCSQRCARGEAKFPTRQSRRCLLDLTLPRSGDRGHSRACITLSILRIFLWLQNRRVSAASYSMSCRNNIATNWIRQRRWRLAMRRSGLSVCGVVTPRLLKLMHHEVASIGRHVCVTTSRPR